MKTIQTDKTIAQLEEIFKDTLLEQITSEPLLSKTFSFDCTKYEMRFSAFCPISAHMFEDMTKISSNYIVRHRPDNMIIQLYKVNKQ